MLADFVLACKVFHISGVIVSVSNWRFPNWRVRKQIYTKRKQRLEKNQW